MAFMSFLSKLGAYGAIGISAKDASFACYIRVKNGILTPQLSHL
jgi:hypothetical protein